MAIERQIIDLVGTALSVHKLVPVEGGYLLVIGENEAGYNGDDERCTRSVRFIGPDDAEKLIQELSRQDRNSHPFP